MHTTFSTLHTIQRLRKPALNANVETLNWQRFSRERQGNGKKGVKNRNELADTHFILHFVIGNEQWATCNTFHTFRFREIRIVVQYLNFMFHPPVKWYQGNLWTRRSFIFSTWMIITKIAKSFFFFCWKVHNSYHGWSILKRNSEKK